MRKHGLLYGLLGGVNIAFTAIERLPVGLIFTLVTAGVLGRRQA